MTIDQCLVAYIERAEAALNSKRAADRLEKLRKTTKWQASSTGATVGHVKINGHLDSNQIVLAMGGRRKQKKVRCSIGKVRPKLY